MSQNDLVLLDSILKTRHAEVAADIADSEFFELFAAEQLLKGYDLSYEELKSGIVDDGGDGGIDGLYLFLNGELVQADTDLSAYKKDISLEWFILQSKTSQGFQEEPLNKLRASLEEALRFDVEISTLASTYNSRVLEAFRLFRVTFTELTPRFPRLSVSIAYATRGDSAHPNVVRKVESVRSTVTSALSGAEVSFEFLGAPQLLSLARKLAPTSFGLALAENPISTGSEGFLCLVRLANFRAFIVDDAGRLRRHLFDANVRDYQGTTEVNAGIKSSLANAPEDFWWLNNGITIIVSQAALSGGKVLTVQDPQIVNGLQTSTEVFEFFRTSPDREDSRNILVRVLVTNDAASRDRIIKATNSQNHMPLASLRATDKIQRDIEDHFKSRGLFYERRKNYYKNERKPIERTISISSLAQAVMAIVVQQPYNSRGRPTSLLKGDDDYARVFDPAYPLDTFYSCIQIMKRVEQYLKARPEKLDSGLMNNIKFHLAMTVTCRALHVPAPTASRIAGLNLNTIDDALLDTCFSDVVTLFQTLGASDQVAKRKEFSDRIKDRLVEDMKAGRL